MTQDTATQDNTRQHVTFWVVHSFIWWAEGVKRGMSGSLKKTRVRQDKDKNGDDRHGTGTTAQDQVKQKIGRIPAMLCKTNKAVFVLLCCFSQLCIILFLASVLGCRLSVVACLVLCLVLSCLVLSCRVVSCRVLACLCLPCLVLSMLVYACLVLSCLVLSCLRVRGWGWGRGRGRGRG